MDPLTATLILGGISAGAQHLTNQDNINASKQAADKQMQFQENMSNTAYQRSKDDMVKAGLNPALMYGSGGAASSPSGAGFTAQSKNPFEQLGNSAIGLMSLKKDLEKKDGEIALSHQMAETQKTQQIANLNTAKAAAASTNKTNTEAEILNDRKKAIKAESDYSEKENRLREKTLYYDYGAEKLNQIMGLASSAKQMKNIGTKLKEIHVDPKTGEILK